MKKLKINSIATRIKQVGTSLGIILNKEYCELNNIEEGDIIELDGENTLIKNDK